MSRVIWALAAVALAALLAACGSAAPSPSPTPASDASGWTTASVEQPSALGDGSTVDPASCSACPATGSSISTIANLRTSYIAFGSVYPSGRALAWRSTDGLNWRPLTSFSPPQGSRVAGSTGSAGGVIAVGSDGREAAAWRSPDGVAWTETRLPGAGAAASDQATAIARTATGYAAGGYEETGGRRQAAFWQSTDGLTWYRVPAPAGGAVEQVTGIAATAGVTIAVGIEGDRTVGTGVAWLSPDNGLSWQRSSTGVFAEGRPLAIAAYGLGFVAVGEATDGTGAQSWTSFGGTSWQRSADQAALSDDGQQAVMTAVSSAGDSVVAVGWRGDAASRSAAAWQSTDGRTWQVLPAARTFSQGAMLAVNARADIVAGGTTGNPDAPTAQVWVLAEP